MFLCLSWILILTVVGVNGQNLSEDPLAQSLRWKEQELQQMATGVNDSTLKRQIEQLGLEVKSLLDLNQNCRIQRINEIPNVRCQNFINRDVPMFEQKFQRFGRNFYLNELQLVPRLEHRQQRLDQCIKIFPMSKEISRTQLYDVHFEAISIEPLSGDSLELKYGIEFQFKKSQLESLVEQMAQWQKQCGRIVLDSMGQWSPYFIQQLEKKTSELGFSIVDSLGQLQFAYAQLDLIQYRINHHRLILIDLANLVQGRLMSQDPIGSTIIGLRGKDTLFQGSIKLSRRGELQGISESFSLANPWIDPRDGHSYPLALFSDQIWMLRNMNFSDDSLLCKQHPMYSCEKYGQLYTWMLAQRACPSPWHLPSLAEWQKFAQRVKKDSSGGFGATFFPMPASGSMMDGHLFDQNIRHHFWIQGSSTKNYAPCWTAQQNESHYEMISNSHCPQNQRMAVRCEIDLDDK